MKGIASPDHSKILLHYPLKPLLINLLRFYKSAPTLARFMKGMHNKVDKKSALPASVLPASPYLCPPVSDPALPVIKAV